VKRLDALAIRGMQTVAKFQRYRRSPAARRNAARRYSKATRERRRTRNSPNVPNVSNDPNDPNAQ
jgi:hypothetical protein